MNDAAEDWAEAPNYRGYSASKDGRVRNDSTGRILRQTKNKVGYATSKLTINGKPTTVNLHRVIANAFWGEMPPGMVINHQDGNRLNNRLDNLEYVTRSANVLHGRRKSTGSAKLAHQLPLLGRVQWAEVVRLLNEGRSRREVAAQLGVSTVYLWRHFDQHVRQQYVLISK